MYGSSVSLNNTKTTPHLDQNAAQILISSHEQAFVLIKASPVPDDGIGYHLQNSPIK
jgi:hypothetical protein